MVFFVWFILISFGGLTKYVGGVYNTCLKKKKKKKKTLKKIEKIETTGNN